MKILNDLRRLTIAVCFAALLCLTLSPRSLAQDESQDDPPTRVARLGYLQGSVSFQPAGESDWVDAVPNRPVTIGDQLWADNNSRAELQLGTAVIDLNGNTGISFLNLDDHTIQVQLSSGAINVRIRRLGRDDDFEIDTPNQAFTIEETGRYRIEASPDGTYTVVSVREGEGESTGNGSTYTVQAGQRVTFDGTETLNAQMEDLGGPDDFDNWCYSRYYHYEHAASARYVSNDVVGYEDLDDNGDWRPAMGYGNVWFPHVAAGWAPYREGHWAWVDPWGWTWVDEEPWGYAPFHYGRWASFSGQWGWVPGPIEVAPVYAPALVVFVGGGGMAFGGNVAWFALGPREVYVPSYPVSRGYLTSINMSGTVVNQTVITNVYNTTIIRNETNITNVTYVNRGVAGAIVAVPQQAFVSAQPVAHIAVAVNARQLASMPISVRAAVAPTPNSVLGAHFNTAGHVAAPPAAIARRAIVARSTPPPAPVPFAARQQALAAHPGQPIARQQMAQIARTQPANTQAARPQIKQAPAGRPATVTAARPGANSPNAPANRPGNQPMSNRPMPNQPAANQPMRNQPVQTQPAQNQPERNQPAANQPANRPNTPPATERAAPQNRPAPETRPAPAARPELNQPEQNNRPAQPPARNERPPSDQAPARNERPQNAQPPNRTEQAQPRENQPAQRPEANRPAEPAQRNEPAARPAPPAKQPPADKKQKDNQKKDDEKKREEKPPGN